MANYCCAIRTNYFHVKNDDMFREFMSQVYGCEDDISLWEEKDDSGQTLFGFGLYGGILGLRTVCDDGDEDSDDSSYDNFISVLQSCVAEDDAIIIFETGNEKLRYVVGSATVITSKGYTYMNINDLATLKAAEMLGNPVWKTRCEY